ncbi:MAG: hypothetical protein HQL55_01915 [Magnetococcales bacterium]|nr:hypothetical protein [Magnetococcales bacterium]
MRRSPNVTPPETTAPSSEKIGPLTWLSAAAGLVFFLYIIGWSYAANYFGHFNLGLATLQLPVEYVLVYAFYALKVLWWAVLLFVAFVAIDLFFLWWLGFFPWYARQSTNTRLVLWMVLALVTVSLGGKLGEISARQAFEYGMVKGFPEMPAVKVTLRDDKNPLNKGLQSGCYRLLAQTQQPDNLYLVQVAPMVSGMPVQVVAGRQVAAMRILAEIPSCDIVR